MTRINRDRAIEILEQLANGGLEERYRDAVVAREDDEAACQLGAQAIRQDTFASDLLERLVREQIPRPREIDFEDSSHAMSSALMFLLGRGRIVKNEDATYKWMGASP